MYEVTLFGIEMTLNPVALTIPLGNSEWKVYWYGILIALGFLGALLYGMKNARRFDIDPDRLIDVILITTPLAILCARCYYLIFDGVKLQSFKDFFGFGDSSGFAGLAIYGGVLGALVIGGLLCLWRKIPLLAAFDLTAVGFLIGQSVGRWGNFMNQEAYGTFTGSTFWGMESNRTIAEMGPGLVHPCFLYESLWCILGFLLLHYLSKRKKFHGQLVLTYGVWYGCGRAVIELLRTDSLMLGKIRVSCLLSVLAALGCAVALYLLLRRHKDTALNEQYESVFAEQTEEEPAQEVEEIIPMEEEEYVQEN